MVARAAFLTTRYGAYLHREVPAEDAELSMSAPTHHAANICAAFGSRSASPMS